MRCVEGEPKEQDLAPGCDLCGRRPYPSPSVAGMAHNRCSGAPVGAPMEPGHREGQVRDQGAQGLGQNPPQHLPRTPPTPAAFLCCTISSWPSLTLR